MSDTGQHPGSPADAGPVDLAGRTLGHFQCVRLLGRGTRSAVWLAQDVSLQRTVALKLIPEQDATNPLYDLWLTQCVAQARGAVQITSPDVVKIYEVGHEGGFFFVAMESLPGGSLEGLVRQKGALSIPDAVAYILQAGEALQFAHQRGVAHGNLKPSNILLTEEGRCKLSEFGLAILEDPGKSLENMKPFIREPHFLAPEVLLREGSIQSDLYSLAATLWYLVSGKHPYPTKELKDVLRVGTELPLNDLYKHCPKAPEPLYDVLERALNYWPEDRFDNFGEMVPYLRAAADPTTLALAAMSHRPARRATPRPAQPPRPATPPGPRPAAPARQPAASAAPAAATAPRPGGTKHLKPAAKRMPPHVLWMILGGAAAIVIAVVALLIVQPWKDSGPQEARSVSPWDAANARKSASSAIPDVPVETPVVDVPIPGSTQPATRPEQAPPAAPPPVVKPNPPAETPVVKAPTPPPAVAPANPPGAAPTAPPETSATKPADQPPSDARGAIVLSAKDVKLKGTGIRLQNINGIDNVGYWNNSREWIVWNDVKLEAGTYEVKGLFATLSPPSKHPQVTVIIAGKKVTGNIPVTGSWEKFQDGNIGREIEIKTAGQFDVEFRPVANRNWYPINVASLTLQKIK